MMRDRMERFVILPFPVGCVSQSSVAVGEDRPKKNNILINTSPKGSPKGEDGESFTAGKAKASTSFLPSFPRTNISAGLQKLVKGFKRISHMFTVFREQEDDDEEVEMVIGFPTDVKHVAHIGWDGATGVPTAAKGGVPELLSLPSISFRQFELAMAAKADAPPPP